MINTHHTCCQFTPLFNKVKDIQITGRGDILRGHIMTSAKQDIIIYDNVFNLSGVDFVYKVRANGSMWKGKEVQIIDATHSNRLKWHTKS
ncbi:hypothetical protein FQP87_22320 [Vibrio tasmaniensis]|nr:hypothetical protein FQP87_22320 [Vibrio tasmaniensis]